jgi:hypothetical protein
MFTVDLDAPPRERWAGLAKYAAPARALLDVYERDLGAQAGAAIDLITAAAHEVLSPETLEELEGVARAIDAPFGRVLLCNLYYDLIKASVGCSAFAVDLPGGPLHARNLDWWTTGGLLRTETLVMDFLRAGAVRYRLVGWPGFIGCFSGVAPGRFAVTLNAALSDDPAIVAEPSVFLLRRVLDEADDFDAALAALRDTPMSSDCLLLLTGARPGELVVIERTPRRAAVRNAIDGFVFVTNDYRTLGSRDGLVGELARTSCARAARLEEQLKAARPPTEAHAFHLLEDARVKMGITVQHMVLRAATGHCEVRLPE